MAPPSPHRDLSDRGEYTQAEPSSGMLTSSSPTSSPTTSVLGSARGAQLVGELETRAERTANTVRGIHSVLIEGSVCEGSASAGSVCEGSVSGV